MKKISLSSLLLLVSISIITNINCIRRDSSPVYTLGILEKDSKLLFLLRQNSKFFNDHYGLMGGTVEQQESVADALIREAYEEIGITITKDNLQFAHCLSFTNANNEDVLLLVFKITDYDIEPINNEPHKCIELAWFAPNELPENIIPRHRQIIEMVYNSILYSEDGW
jgi:8-oxo-dGTP diphosphatase